jgi:hypothetical protein
LLVVVGVIVRGEHDEGVVTNHIDGRAHGGRSSYQGRLYRVFEGTVLGRCFWWYLVLCTGSD